MHETETRPRWITPMRPRSPDEAHRAATPLELLFDLVFVVAVAQAASSLHHGIAEGHVGEVLPYYVMVFFAIWWAWMTFTWFASSYDNDDVPYRLLVFVQMTGALIVASGVEQVFVEQDLTVIVIGYVVMRIAGVAQWLRAAQADPSHRPADLRYAIGTVLLQVGWVLLLSMPKAALLPLFVVGVVLELLLPIWAERPSPTPWHEHHIRERYGLFTIIVLGEAILSNSVAIRVAADEVGMTGSLMTFIVGGLLIVYSMWWLYFYQPAPGNLTSSMRVAFTWAYGHWLIFASSAAVGVGLALAIDAFTHNAEITVTEAGLALAVPTALYVLSLWVLQDHINEKTWFDTLLNPVAAVLILLTPFVGNAVLLTGIILVVLVALRLIRHLE
ncbi:MAG: low temperature requirement protein A [Chloroflexota bacterium]